MNNIRTAGTRFPFTPAAHQPPYRNGFGFNFSAPEERSGYIAVDPTTGEVVAYTNTLMAGFTHPVNPPVDHRPVEDRVPDPRTPRLKGCVTTHVRIVGDEYVVIGDCPSGWDEVGSGLGSKLMDR
jgi:hypothetical protein